MDNIKNQTIDLDPKLVSQLTLFTDKEVITVKDIEGAYGVSYSSATSIMRAIKHFSDVLGTEEQPLKGICHRCDYIFYITRNLRK